MNVSSGAKVELGQLLNWEGGKGWRQMLKLKSVSLLEKKFKNEKHEML